MYWEWSMSAGTTRHKEPRDRRSGSCLLRKDLQGHLDLPERRAYLHALHRALHLLKHLPRDLYAFGERGLFAFVLRPARSEEHTSELQSRLHLVCRLLLEKKKISEAPTYHLALIY